MPLLPISKPLQTNIIRSTATEAFRQEMWNLYNRYYQVDRSSFFKRFQTNDLYALYTCDEKLVGFTGFRMKTIQTEYGRCQTLYIGQTVMDARYRGKSMLPRTCCKLFAQHFMSNPLSPIYVWCDSLTYKPYLLFANSLKAYFPSRHQATPAKEKAIIDQLGQHYYGDDYDQSTGTVHKAKNIIADPSTLISPKDRQHPDIDFFAQANPNYANGHGLITLAKIDGPNFLFLLKKCWKKMMGKK